ncbi:hypothetical protein UVI_02035220 [Ustilaginoidea virens]|nr:hypothetical protein UVI_02035220 [Ustilaginoidea virens]
MTESNMSYVYTLTGYAALFGLGYAAYLVSTQKTNKRAAANAPRAARAAQNEPRKEDRKKKQRLDSFTSEAQEAARAKASTKATATEPASRPRPVAEDTSDDDDDDDGADNREFARQLAKAQEGKKFAGKAEASKQREKSVKQSRAHQMSNGYADEKPSDTGAEADDDQSPIGSPEAYATDAAGISDMLEPIAAGPSVVRITDADKVKEKKPKAAKPLEKAETKKQRQNKKKAEAAKEAREASEKERKVLEEKQRRTARIAQGRAAKDGSQFMATNGVNSWAKGEAGAPSAGSDKVFHQPLDTSEMADAPAATATPDKQAAVDQSEGSWISSLPSEEEQMEMLKNDADEWNTVQTKSKKSKKGVESGDEKSTKPSTTQAKQAHAAPKTAPKAAAPQALGSFSALRDDAPEEVEEEWEV